MGGYPTEVRERFGHGNLPRTCLWIARRRYFYAQVPVLARRLGLEPVAPTFVW